MDSFGDRMKRYEHVTRTHLTRRTPVIIRVDGQAFHTFCKLLPKNPDTPYNDQMNEAMTFTAYSLVRSIQGCVLAYKQSDEISLLIRDWDTIETQAWFDYNIQKMVSISASIASNAFNAKIREQGVDTRGKYACFDARVFNIPKEEVANYFIWRQQDASRNSIQAYGHHFFSQKQMHGKNNSQVQDMLMLEKGVNWNDMPTWTKRGVCVTHNNQSPFSSAPHQDVDMEIPVFTQDRQYIERFLEVQDD